MQENTLETVISDSGGFAVSLEVFDGPIDLLLHLVKQNELPIERISLAAVTVQYLEYLERMRQFDLEIAGEYLVIAATLLSIKSSLLLAEPVELELDEDGEKFDPHEELLRRLREAEVYKEGAKKLSSRDILGVDVFSPPPSLDSVPRPAAPLKAHDPMLLGKAFCQLLERVKEDPTMNISVDTVSIVDRMMSILEQLKARSEATVFTALIPEITSRVSIIGTFIALLELCKRHMIRVEQDAHHGEIVVSVSGEVSQGVESHPESDSFERMAEGATANG